MSDILILGYYGFKNSGDDTLLLSIIEQIRNIKQDVNICVLSENPEETRQNYGVGAVKRDNPLLVLKAILDTKMLLVGGGTLIQDHTSKKSLLYYLSLIRVSSLLGKKIMLYSNGIGRISDKNADITRKVLNKVNIITLRDEMSQKELERLGVTRPEIHLCADCVFGLDTKDKMDKNAILEKYKIPKNTKYFCVSVRDVKDLGTDFSQKVALVCDYIYSLYGCYPIFVPLQRSKDSEMTNEVASLLDAPYGVIDDDCTLLELLGLISGAKMFLGMRLHSLIYASICNVPSVGLSYDEKVSAFMDYIGQNAYVDTDNFTANELKKICDEVFKNEDAIKQSLIKEVEKMKRNALVSAKLAINLLNR